MAKIIGNSIGKEGLIRSGAALATSVLSMAGDRTLGKAFSKVNQLTSNPILGKIVSQGWRNALFISRALSNKAKDTSAVVNLSPDPAKGHIAMLGVSDPTKILTLGSEEPEKVPGFAGNIKQTGQRRKIARIVETSGSDPAEISKPVSAKKLARSSTYLSSLTKNKVIIYNLTKSPYEYIVLQNRPSELINQGSTSWAEIKSMGRNLPMYHYLGGQDEIHLNISWFCNDNLHPEEVLAKCRLLESWTKSDGYIMAPPILRIQWGSSEMLANYLFILTSATYTLSNFRSVAKDYRNPNQLQGTTYDGLLLPGSATQELIFKRVAGYNLSKMDYLPGNMGTGVYGMGTTTKLTQTQIPL